MKSGCATTLIEDTLRLTLWNVLVNHMIHQLELVTGYHLEHFLDSNIYRISLIIYCRNVLIRKLDYLIQKGLILMTIRSCRCGRMLCKI
nr:MAG TPA: hypothetical protein [Caudoviricetes sp.]